jgi:hypothetical protein
VLWLLGAIGGDVSPIVITPVEFTEQVPVQTGAGVGSGCGYGDGSIGIGDGGGGNAPPMMLVASPSNNSMLSSTSPPLLVGPNLAPSSGRDHWQIPLGSTYGLGFGVAPPSVVAQAGSNNPPFF